MAPLLFDVYLAFHDQERSKYGAKASVVGMEVGTFTEFYGTDDVGADVAGLCALLNIVHTRKNKAQPISRSNPSMAGFPTSALLQKYLPVLLRAGKTLSFVTQVTAAPHVTRAVTRVFSPSTYDPAEFWGEGQQQLPTHNRVGPLMSLFVTKMTPNLTVGLATIDVSTGESTASCESGPERSACQAVSNAIDVAAPSEVLLTLVGPTPTGPAAQLSYDACLSRLQTRFGLASHTCVVVRTMNRGPTAVEQEEVLRRTFPNKGMLSSRAFSNLDKLPGEATNAFVLGVRFIHDHDSELILGRVRPPRVSDSEVTAVRMPCQTLGQLNITGEAGLCRLLCAATRTPAGARLMKRQLMTPTHDRSLLDERLDRMASLGRDGDVKAVQQLLAGTGDLERSFQRVVSKGRGVSHHWVRGVLGSAIRSAGEALAHSPWAGCDAVAHAAAMQTLIVGHLGPALDSRHGATDGGDPFFARGVHPTLDLLQDGLASSEAELGRVVGTLNMLAGGSDHFRLLPCGDTECGCVTSTPLRLEALKRSAHGRTLPVHAQGHLSPTCIRIAELSSELKPSFVVRHPALDLLVEARRAAHQAFGEAQGLAWAGFLDGLVHVHALHMHEIVEAVSELDVCAANAYNSVTLRLSRPTFVEGDAGRLDARALRHPLIQSLRHDTEYVANDLALDPDGPCRGMLLYGVNASGKSSLMKSVGVAVLMAQCGMHVAADALVLRPYRSLCTRIGSRDDLERGHSTFVVEMLELRDILAQADAFSLVIGDELCSGTEAISAQSIVAAAIVSLHRERASFVFATHLHGLGALPVLVGLTPPLRVAHLGVRFVKDTLVYDRRLEEGSGHAVYGLEIAKGLDMPLPFLHIADKTRRHLMGVEELTPSRRSAYNTRVGVGGCAVCGSVTTPRETHHIRPQASADSAGFTGHFHKNSAFNLVILCTVCHDDVHAGRIRVNGYVDTCENGTVLDVVR